MNLDEILKIEKISIKDSKEINEALIQEYISKNPKVLGLGELFVRDKERIQPNSGRLDLLMQDQENNIRYEVEIQLGKTNESHIIRTIEYWDVERKRYPMYDHCAVIIAEDITSRFSNIINLFNGHIPIIAIQVNAYIIEGKIALVFTKVFDAVKLGFDDEDEEGNVPADKSYWENIGSKETVEIADDICLILKEIEPSLNIKYNKPYIGITKNGIAFNFSTMTAKKAFLRLDMKLERSDNIDEIIEKNKIDALEYNSRTNKYKIRLTKKELKDKKDIIKELLISSYNAYCE